MAPTDDAFYREAKSQIRALNDGLLAVERGEGAAVPELFRVAHSLKGSCRTRGLDEAGDLAHAVEDALDALRAGEVEPTPALVDEALATVDLLEATVRADAVGGEVDEDVGAACASLRAALGEERGRAPTEGDATLDAPSADRADADDWDPAAEGLSDEVVEALEATSEFDDIDALLDGMDAPSDEADLDGWGMLGDDEVDGDAPQADGVASEGGSAAAGDSAPAPSPEPGPAETPDEPSTFFEETKRRVDDDQGIDDLQADIDAVEFGEFDDEDNYTIEELMALEPGESPDEATAEGPAADEAPAEGSAETEAPAEGTPPDEERGPDADAAESAAGGDASGDPPVDLLGAGGPDTAAANDESAEDPNGTGDEAADPVGDPLGLADADLSRDDGPAADPSPDDGPTGGSDGSDDSAEESTDAGESTGADEGAADAEARDTAEASDSDADTDGTASFVFGTGAADAPETDEGTAVAPDESESESTPDDGADPERASGADETDGDAVGGDDATADAGSVPDTDSVPAADSTPDAESLPHDVADVGALAEPTDGSDPGPDADAIPDADSLPETDLGVDLSGEFDADAESDAEAGDAADLGDEVGMDVAVDEEMAEFESRFDDLLGTGPSDDADEGAVFRSAVPTIEDSSLDAAAFPNRGGDRPEGTREFDRLQATTVDVDTADRLLNVAEELSLSHLRLDEAVGPETDDAVREEVSNLLRIVTEYRRTVVDVRLMPLETAVEAIPRTVRDVARSQGKEVELVVDDADVELDRSIVDRLRDPLVHLARNAVDHGIEPPEEREAAGKAPEGTVAISAERVGDEVVVELSDDGRGVDPEAVRERAVERGVLTHAEAAELSDDETYDLLFEPGFTTAEAVTDVSGRGVGMDVVHRTVADLNGTVTVDSDPGVGTTVRLTVPVSIALTEVLFVEAAGQTFGVPMTAVEQITAAPPVETEGDREVVRRSDLDLVGGLPEGVEADDAYPHVELASALDLDGAESADDGTTDDGQVVWIRTQAGRLAVRVGRVVASQEVVVRPYGDLLRDVPGVSGATTLGDGRAVNVLDVATL